MGYASGIRFHSVPPVEIPYLFPPRSHFLPPLTPHCFVLPKYPPPEMKNLSQNPFPPLISCGNAAPLIPVLLDYGYHGNRGAYPLCC